jgi:hypothetical protein
MPVIFYKVNKAYLQTAFYIDNPVYNAKLQTAKAFRLIV